MLYWLLQIIIISIILIFLVHHLIQFFKDTLTVPKIKDLVNTPRQKYENMFSVMNGNNENSNFHFDENYKKSLLPQNDDFQHVDKYENLDDKYNINILSSSNEFDANTMKNELKSYLKNQYSNNETVVNYINGNSTKRKVKITEL
jgi:hypothetical protein